MDMRLCRLLEEDMEYDQFRSEISHKYRYDGDHKFIKDLIEYNLIGVYWERKWYDKALYIVAMMDCITDRMGLERYKDYDFYRQQKLREPRFPKDIILVDTMFKGYKEKVMDECKNNEVSKYFLKYNIIEKSFEDVP